MTSKLLVCNWKMNGSQILIEQFCNKIGFRDNVLFALPSIYLSQYKDRLHLCAQNCSIYDDYGSKTGEISPMLLNENGINSIIIGHSECRTYSGDTADRIYAKVSNCLKHNMRIILCVDETYEQQLSSDLLALIRDNNGNAVVAYEPISAIGTGVIPNIADINHVCSNVNQICKVPVLYGGSVNNANAYDILSCNGVSGVLIGGASLKIDAMLDIININNNIYH